MMASRRIAKRCTVFVGMIGAVVVAILATTTRTKPFPCEEYNMHDTKSGDAAPRRIGCLFQHHIHDKTSASITQEGRIQRDSDTVFWSLFGNAFAANPNTPYLYTTLPLFSFDLGWWWPPFAMRRTKVLSWLLSPMWRFSNSEDVAVFIGKLPPETVYFGFTTFVLWRPFRFVFASLGDSYNGLTLHHDPETGLFAYVICFATNTEESTSSTTAYGAVMEALVASGLPESAINVQALDPELLPSKWSYYELVLRIFQFRNETEGNLYLQSHAHDHPFYYVSAGNSMRNNHKPDGTCSEDQAQDNDSTAPKKKWPVASKPTGFKKTFHRESIREKEKLTPSFLQYGREVLSDLHQIFSTPNKTGDSSVVHSISSYHYTNHSFGPLYVAEGTDCLKHNTECLGGCPDAAYFGLNVVDGAGESTNFETLPSWPSPNELHVVTVVDHRTLHNSVYGSLALLASSSKVLDQRYLTKNVRATSVGVTSPDLFGGDRGTQANANSKDRNETSNSVSSSSLPFAAWVFARNPDICRILSHHRPRYGCTVIDSRQLSSSNKYVTYLERIYLNPLTKTRPDYDSILPARLYRVFLEDESTKKTNSNKNENGSTSLFSSRLDQNKDIVPTTNDNDNTNTDTDTNTNNLPFSKIKLPPSQSVATFEGDEPLRFLHIIKTGGESLERYIWKEPSLKINYGACIAAATKVTKYSSLGAFSSLPTKLAAERLFPFSTRNAAVRGKACNALATLTSSALCGVNCECCASDLFAREKNDKETPISDKISVAFHGTMLRSPRAHVLSQYSHCHASHHTTWGRIAGDTPLYFAEGILRMTEEACWSSCDTEGDPDWFAALQKRLGTDERTILPYYSNENSDVAAVDSLSSRSQTHTDRVLVISIHNTQSHALTCGKSKGSFGHHFRRIVRRTKNSEQDEHNKNGSSATTTANTTNLIDEYTPSLQDALSALDRFEWFGITELFMPSLCLLHYQANKDLPPQCDCDSPDFVEHDQQGALGYWKETRSEKRGTELLTPTMLRQIDDHTTVDASLYSHAVSVFLGKLVTVEEATGTSLLKCIQWDKFRANTDYLTDLWNDGPNGLLV